MIISVSVSRRIVIGPIVVPRTVRRPTVVRPIVRWRVETPITITPDIVVLSAIVLVEMEALCAKPPAPPAFATFANSDQGRLRGLPHEQERRRGSAREPHALTSGGHPPLIMPPGNPPYLPRQPRLPHMRRWL